MSSPMRFNFRLLLLCFTGSVFGTGTQFLSLPGNSAELSTGSNMLQGGGLNPASFSLNNPGAGIEMSFGNWFADARISGVHWASNTANRSLSIALKYVSLNDLELRTETPTDEPLAQYGVSGTALSAAYALSFRGTNIGAALKWIRIDLYYENSSGYALDLGLTKKLNSRTRLGMALLNLGAMSRLQNEIPRLPVRALITGQLAMPAGQFDHEISLTCEWSSMVDHGIVYLATQTSWNQLQLRLGGKFSTAVTEIRGGIGIRLGRYQINYGASIGSQNLGIPQMIDLAVQLP